MILTDKDLQLLNSMQSQPIDSATANNNNDTERTRDTDLKIEFDGTTVLCRVCGDKASGFHYGVHSCEGCKGFFRRSIQQKIQYRPCTKNQQCSILRINRNRCQYCRLKKCIAVGMSRDAVRFGRVPKREKAKILAAMQKVNAHSLEKALSVVLEDENNLASAIVKAHEETCDYTREKVAPLLDAARSRPVYTQCPPQMTCPLNPMPQATMDGSGGISRKLEEISERFSPAISGVVEFAKRIPGFGMLSQEDQVTLLKAGVFEVLLVRLACMFDSQTNSMVCLNGLVLRRDSLHSASNARFLMDSMFEFAERLNSLRLSDQEIGLFCAVVVIAPDRPGIRNIDLVQKINKRLEEVLQKTIAANHPDNPGNLFVELTKKIPDLRTLNTLHSEKLLSKNTTVLKSGGSTRMESCGPSTGHLQPQPDSQSDNSPDRWSSSSSMGHFSPHSADDNRGSVSPGHHDWNDSKDGGCFGSPRSMSSSSGVSSDDNLSRKGSISLTSAPGKLAYYAAGAIESHEESAALAYPASSSTSVVVTGSAPTSVLVTPHPSPHLHHLYGGAKVHRVDSPTDSGVECGGKEHGSSHTPTTSVCSSPRSALEEKLAKETSAESALCDKQESIDDMPVLKRALQAPPLVNTNKLMDEAYRHHKKFRAARRDTEPHSPSTTSGVLVMASRAANTVAPPSAVSTSLPVIQSTPPAAASPSLASSLASSHSTLLKTLEQPSRYLSEQQLKRTDLIHNIIMNSEAVNTPAMLAPAMRELPVASSSASSAFPAGSSSSSPHPVYVAAPPTTLLAQACKEGVSSLMYPPAYYPHHSAAPASCPFSAGRVQPSPPAHHAHMYHAGLGHHRATPSPTYLESHSPSSSPSSSASSTLLVIGSSPSPSAISTSPRAALAHSPYSHLQRCLTATTAPSSATTNPMATAQTLSEGGVPLMGPTSDLDLQPLNLSKKPSAPPSPASNTSAIKMEVD